MFISTSKIFIWLSALITYICLCTLQKPTYNYQQFLRMSKEVNLSVFVFFFCFLLQPTEAWGSITLFVQYYSANPQTGLRFEPGTLTVTTRPAHLLNSLNSIDGLIIDLRQGKGLD